MIIMNLLFVVWRIKQYILKVGTVFFIWSVWIKIYLITSLILL